MTGNRQVYPKKLVMGASKTPQSSTLDRRWETSEASRKDNLALLKLANIADLKIRIASFFLVQTIGRRNTLLLLAFS